MDCDLLEPGGRAVDHRPGGADRHQGFLNGRMARDAAFRYWCRRTARNLYWLAFLYAVPGTTRLPLPRYPRFLVCPFWLALLIGFHLDGTGTLSTGMVPSAARQTSPSVDHRIAFGRFSPLFAEPGWDPFGLQGWARDVVLGHRLLSVRCSTNNACWGDSWAAELSSLLPPGRSCLYVSALGRDRMNLFRLGLHRSVAGAEGRRPQLRASAVGQPTAFKTSFDGAGLSGG